MVDYCVCGHAHQLHQTPGLPCRGACWAYTHGNGHTPHQLNDHTGPCTARCICDQYHPRKERP